MACGGCGGSQSPEAEQVTGVEPVTGKPFLEMTMLERLEYAHRMQAKEILESQDPPATKRQKLSELDDWLERNKQSPSFSV